MTIKCDWCGNERPCKEYDFTIGKQRFQKICALCCAKIVDGQKKIMDKINEDIENVSHKMYLLEMRVEKLKTERKDCKKIIKLFTGE